MVVVVADEKAAKVLGVLRAQPVDQRLRRHAFALGFEHGRGAVGVVRANVDALVAGHALETHPNIRLDVLEQMAEMDGAVGVRQCAGDEDSTHGLTACRRARNYSA